MSQQLSRGNQWLHDIAVRQANVPRININIEGISVKGMLLQSIYDQIQTGSSFALRASNGETVYFLFQKFMVAHGGRADAVTKLETQHDFENALKIVIIGHGELITGHQLLSSAPYQLFIEALAK